MKIKLPFLRLLSVSLLLLNTGCASTNNEDAGNDVTDAGNDVTDAGNDATDAGNDATDAGNAFVEPAGVKGVVDAHNVVRAEAMPVPVPALPDLTWSQSAADVAQAWAARCEWGHNPDRGTLGENIAVWSGTQNGSGVAGVEMWASEVSDYDYENNSCAVGQQCGHYTQIVWRSTLAVGCALQTCDVVIGLENFGRSQLLVCDYAPPGNYPTQPY
ncbi:MAG: hypothetical protein GY822_19435 [Deltaproteobacteria bacterium]|nr:hypothetical protein [Deltaproteobacteria bacterium]